MKMDDNKERQELTEHRDRIAIAAMQGLMRHWELFDEHGGSINDYPDKLSGLSTFTSMAGAVMNAGWGACHPILDRETYASALAEDAYFIAQEMLRCRNKLDRELDLLVALAEPEARS